MLYVLEQGKTEKAIIEQCIRERMPLPDTIANAPELGPGLDFFYTAFLDLTSERKMGFSAGPVGWLSIHEYAKAYEVTGEQREDLFYHVQKLDEAYLKWSNDRNSKGKSSSPSKKKPRRRR